MQRIAKYLLVLLLVGVAAPAQKQDEPARIENISVDVDVDKPNDASVDEDKSDKPKEEKPKEDDWIDATIENGRVIENRKKRRGEPARTHRERRPENVQIH